MFPLIIAKRTRMLTSSTGDPSVTDTFICCQPATRHLICRQVAASEKRVIEVNKDCIWFTSKQRLLVETLRTSLLWAIERFYAHVHDNVYVALLELPDVMQRTMDEYDGTPVTQKEYKQRLLSDYLQVCVEESHVQHN